MPTMLTRRGLETRQRHPVTLTPELVQRALSALRIDPRTERLPQSAILAGAQVELEHTDDVLVAVKIAVDHLRERRDYYTRLSFVEGLEGAPELAFRRIAPGYYSAQGLSPLNGVVTPVKVEVFQNELGWVVEIWRTSDNVLITGGNDLEPTYRDAKESANHLVRTGFVRHPQLGWCLAEDP